MMGFGNVPHDMVEAFYRAGFVDWKCPNIGKCLKKTVPIKDLMSFNDEADLSVIDPEDPVYVYLHADGKLYYANPNQHIARDIFDWETEKTPWLILANESGVNFNKEKV